VPKKESFFEDDPLWYKDAVIYELHVKTFFDRSGDGVGDFRGLIRKLDYLADLGVTAIWLLPFYPSPLRDDGYDIADYFNVNPQYGTLRDFKDFLREAHKRGLRVITELVLNHTSDQHAWFQKARKAKPGSAQRNYYVWSDLPEKYRDARIIFKDFEPSNWSWDPVAKQYYWHRFYSHQPDLNFESPALMKAVQRALDFWFEMGIDGMRLDAIPYLYEKEGTNCENLPETYEVLRKLRKYLDSRHSNKMFLAEANQWPEDAVAYFGEGDMCHMAFHFPLMPRMFMALQMADRFPIIDILEQTPAIHDSCQWAMFLRNHDELTLEMVTDEERDYMYRLYAKDSAARINLGIRRRLAPLLGNHRRKIELMNVLLFSMPGTPVIYYGDEIGMGDNYYLGDRNGVRTPMQWSSDRNAGFSRVNPHKLYLPVIIDPEYHYESVNVENQQGSSASLLWWMKHTIAVRKRYKAFSRGSLEFILPDNHKIIAFVRRHEDEIIFVAANLSKYAQTSELDLSQYASYLPVEVFSHSTFSAIKETPYPLTFAPYGYYIFELKAAEAAAVIDTSELPELQVSEGWERIFEGKALEKLERKILPVYLKQRRWFGGKARTIRQVNVIEKIPIQETSSSAFLLFIKVKYSEGAAEIYSLSLSFLLHKMSGDEEEITVEGSAVILDYDWLGVKAERVLEESSQAVVARLIVDGEEGILFDSLYNQGFRDRIFEMIRRRKKVKGQSGELYFYPGKIFKQLLGDDGTTPGSKVLKAEQSNTSLIYEDRYFFKLYRRLDEGINPDLEVTRFLTEKTKFTNLPPFVGAMEYRRPGSESYVVGILQGHAANQGDTWTYTLDVVRQYFDRVLARKRELKSVPEMNISLFESGDAEVPNEMIDLVGAVYLEMALLLGERTAELHLALSSDDSDPSFAPENFSLLYQRSVYQSMRSKTRKVFQQFGKILRKLPDNIREEAKIIYESEKAIIKYYENILKKKIPVTKSRIHGDYHLGQVLYTGKDFIIIDFEGEPARPLSERKLKRSPLVDVAGMIRSFHYAVHAEYFNHVALRPEDAEELVPWLDLWFRCVSRTFLDAYITTAGNAGFVPGSSRDLEILVQVFILEKAVYELGYELNNRPDWLVIPFRGIKNILGDNM
jgi:maltose alpha-D-glucosyltransferase/alpha-amylase